MDSIGNLLSLTNHRTFSERLLARVDHVVCAKIEENRLYLCVKTRGKVPEDLLLTLCCAASSPERDYAPIHTVIETAVRLDENHVMLATGQLDGLSDFHGALPRFTSILLEKGQSLKTFNMPGVNNTSKPQP